MNIEENRLIAEFRGYEADPHFHDYYSKKGCTSFSIKEGDPIECCKFHSSWDWIMQVVEDIEKIDEIRAVTIQYYDLFNGVGTYKVQIGRDTEDNPDPDNFPIEIHKPINNVSSTDKLKVLYTAIVKFIKWYNNKNKI